MNEVSCRVMWLHLEATRHAGVDLQRLVEGLPFDVQHLSDTTRRISWESYCTLNDRLQEFCGGPAGLERSATMFAQAPVVKGVTSVMGLVSSARTLYWVSHKWFGHAMFTIVGSTFDELEDGRIRITLKIPDHCRDSAAFFRINAGVFRSNPRILGQPDSRVEYQLFPRRAVYLIDPPPSLTLLARVQRAFKMVFAAASVFKELGQQQAQLKARFDELNAAHTEIAAQARQLAAANATLELKVAERTAQLEQSLQKVTEADRLKTEFFANASHELRTPLTLMLGPLEVLARTQGLSPDAKAEVGSVVHSGYKLLKLVNDLLDLSKIEAGRMTLQMGAADLVQVLRDVIRPWPPALKSRQIALSVELPTVLPLAGDAERLEQVALNLLSNAVKFTPDGGQIAIKAGRDGQGLFFSIENSGEGIEPEDLGKLFGRFTQSTRSRSRRFGSTGLGLPVVRELVELHGGTIEAESTLGQWSRFTVRLPEGRRDGVAAQQVSRATTGEMLLYEAAAARESSAAAPAAIVTGESDDLPTLLVAEDNEAMRAFIVRNLRASYRVIEAADGAQALALAREHLPDVILSDLMMPELDGVQLCAALKSEPTTANIPFVLLTARADIETRVGGIDKGADDYLLKPFNLEELRARLRSQLRVRQLAIQVAHREKLAALGAVVAGVAHEIRNPLNGIINALAPLKELIPDASPDTLELIDLAIESSKRVEYISDQLLKQGRAGEGERGNVDLAQNVGLALQLLSHKLLGGVALTSDLQSGKALSVLGEAGALHQVWVNLIDNAIQAASPSGKVNVAVTHGNGHALVEVSDTGPGIDPRHLKRIFDPFFTTKAVGSGTGLGLAIVREIVEKHGGEISVDSAPGRGARFIVKLPTTAPGASNVVH